jgi:hypothetical protein
MDTLDEFQAWLDDSIHKGKLGPHDWLVRLAQRELDSVGGKKKIVVSGPLVMQGLRKRTK